MDVVGVAHVEIMEKFERALKTDEPVKFLLSSAAYEMESHVKTHDPMIIRPRYGKERMRRLDPVPATTVSLDVPPPDGEHPLTETLAAARQPQEDSERREQRKYSILYQEINKLRPTLKHSIIASYGLFGEPARTNHELAKAYKLTKRAVNDRNLRARRILAERLAPYRRQLTRG